MSDTKCIYQIHIGLRNFYHIRVYLMSWVWVVVKYSQVMGFDVP